jgi:hypothetical protein
MSPREWISLLVALILWAPLSVFIVQALKGFTWPDGVKAALSLVVCALVGIAGTWVNGSLLGILAAWGHGLTAQTLLVYIGTVYALAQIEYQAYFKALTWMTALGIWPKGPSG